MAVSMFFYYFFVYTCALDLILVFMCRREPSRFAFHLVEKRKGSSKRKKGVLESLPFCVILIFIIRWERPKSTWAGNQPISSRVRWIRWLLRISAKMLNVKLESDSKSVKLKSSLIVLTNNTGFRIHFELFDLFLCIFLFQVHEIEFCIVSWIY